MISLDTNVLVRAVLVEADADELTRAQKKRAKEILSSGADLYVPITVVQELEWVLRAVYEAAPTEVIALLEDLLAVTGMTVDRASAVRQAVDWYRKGMDFSDALHLAQSGLCTELQSFDRSFQRSAGRLAASPAVRAPHRVDSP
jgi:predicted nucleic-acid-binding protein